MASELLKERKRSVSFHTSGLNEMQQSENITRRSSWLQVPGVYENPSFKDECGDVPNGLRKDSVFGGDSTYQHNTYEPSPCVANYRNSITNAYLARPTLEELHNPAEKNQLNRFEQNLNERKRSIIEQKGIVKFGWIRGVYLRCILNIWGVMLFLRMGWMTGQAGIGLSIVIVLLSTVITMITTMSMSAICTNGEVKGGGAYYLISRSLGPEVGGAVGVIFSFANSIAVAMYIVGAAEAVRDILRVFNVGITAVPSDVNDVRIAGIALLILVTVVTGIGMAFENKAQIVLLILLLAALMDYFVGACFTPTPKQIVSGFTGWTLRNANENFGPDFRDNQSFFGVFSIFFPSVIGILAGANISGDLKNPSSALPKGTFLAIITTSVSYIIIIIWLGFTLLRDASGIIEELGNDTFRNCSLRHCSQGMMNYNQVMEMSSAWPPLIYVGIFSATLSSALAALVSAPRLFQALCKDNIFPKLKFFGKGYGPNNDPRRSAALAFLIALIFIVIGDLNEIAPYISNFYMATYCLINFACFHASICKSPGFRPGFKYYNKWVSLLGAVLCVSTMFVMGWITALVTFCIVVGLYVYIQKFNPDINWGSSTQGFSYKNALSSVLKLNKVEEHVKNYRPAILVLTGNPCSRPPLIDFASQLSRNCGLMICGHVVQEHISHAVKSLITDYNYKWLEKRNIKAFYSQIENESKSSGVYSLLQSAGLGKLHPNILLMGYKSDWQTADSKEVQDYFQIIHYVFDMHLSIAIFRVKTGLDYGQYFELNYNQLSDADAEKYSKRPLVSCSSWGSIGGEVINNEKSDSTEITIERKNAPEELSANKLNSTAKMSSFKRLNSTEITNNLNSDIPSEIMEVANQFQTKQKQGTIDVWWLSDDGGLTILLPYLLTTRSQWSNCELRVFSVTNDTNLEQAQVNMAALLKKFRIDFSAVTVLSDFQTAPTEQSKIKFKELISNWVINEENDPENKLIGRTDLSSHKQKTYKYLRLRELLEKYSQNSSLIVMTLPMPRKGSCPTMLYMAWLENLTCDMPPFLLIRGNQTSVLTFYS